MAEEILPMENGLTVFTFYAPKHEIVKNIGLCVARLTPEYKGGTYVLAIHLGENFIYPIYIGKTVREVVGVGKEYICGIREGRQTIPLCTIDNPKTFGNQVRRGEIKIMIELIDEEIIDATEELNNLDVKSEIQKECNEDRLKNCHTCLNYIPGYNMCRKVAAPIDDVKACTAYESNGRGYT